MAKLIVYAKILKTEFLNAETLHDFSPIKESRDKEKKRKNSVLSSRKSFNRDSSS